MPSFTKFSKPSESDVFAAARREAAGADSQVIVATATVTEELTSYLYDYMTVSDDGFLTEFDSKFALTENYDTLADSMSGLGSGQLAIVCDVIPYTYNHFNDSSEHIRLYSTAVNVEMTDPFPANAVDSFTATIEDSDTGAYYAADSDWTWASPLREYKRYDINYDSQERGRILAKLGYNGALSDSQHLSASWIPLADEIFNQLTNTTKKVFDRTAASPLVPNLFSTINPMNPISSSAPTNVTMTNAGNY